MPRVSFRGMNPLALGRSTLNKIVGNIIQCTPHFVPGSATMSEAAHPSLGPRLPFGIRSRNGLWRNGENSQIVRAMLRWTNLNMLAH
jgi:hypothetical protein